MENPETILKIAKKKSEKLKEHNEIVANIYEIFNNLGSKPINRWSLPELGRAAARLSIYMVNLSEIVAEASLLSNSSYAFRKFQYVKKFRSIRQEIDSKIKDSEMEAQEQVSGEVVDEILAQYDADMLKGLYDSTSRFVSIIQSWLRVAEGEKHRGKMEV